MNASWSSGQDKTKGPDPLIKLVTHPKAHVIIPSGSFVLLHCEANYTDDLEYDYENDDGHAYLPSEDDLVQNDDPNPIHETSTVASLCAHQDVQYQWLRNDKPIDANGSFIQTFCNGTIQIKHSSIATGIYRCVASTTKPDIGAVVSKASNVKAAGKLLAISNFNLNHYQYIESYFYQHVLQFSSAKSINSLRKLKWVVRSF